MHMKNIWYSTNTNLQSPDAIHQTLMFGSLSDIKSLKDKVGKRKIKKIFLMYPKKIYTNEALNFIKNFILNISTSVDEKKYLKHTPRYTG